MEQTTPTTASAERAPVMTEAEFVAIDELSELIEVALIDAERLDPAVYALDAGEWHKPVYQTTNNETACIVCLAGSVMANWTDPKRRAEPCNFANMAVVRRLRALEDARAGAYVSAVLDMCHESGCLGKKLYTGLTNVPTAAYNQFHTRGEFNKFAKSMRRHVLPALRKLGV